MLSLFLTRKMRRAEVLQLREQSARKTSEERTGIVNAREDKRLNKALGSKRIMKAPNFANKPQVKEGGPKNIANVGGPVSE
jgi:hypothetical protein